MNGDVAGRAAYTPEDMRRMRTNEVLHEFDFELADIRRAHPVNPAETTVLGSVTEFHQGTRARSFSIACARVAARLAKIGAV